MSDKLYIELTEVGDIKMDYPTSFGHWHAQGFTHAVEKLKIVDRHKFREAMSSVSELIDTYKVNQVEIYVTDWIIASVYPGNRLSLFGRTPFSAATFIKQFSDHIVKLNTENSVETWYFVNTPGGVSDRYIYLDLDKMPNIIPELYPDVDIDKLAEQFYAGDESIMILYGEPGIGKTSFIKRILCSGYYKEVGYAKDRDAICSGDFWSQVASKNLDLLIFDDLDFGIGPRQEGDNGFVTNLLSYSDGIFNTKCKIIITTNQKPDKVDQALVRPGRCFDFLVLSPLSRTEAKSVWAGVLQMDPTGFDSIFGVNVKTITQAKLMAEYKMVLDKRRTRDYMKKDKTALVERLEDLGLSEKRVGF